MCCPAKLAVAHQVVEQHPYTCRRVVMKLQLSAAIRGPYGAQQTCTLPACGSTHGSAVPFHFFSFFLGETFQSSRRKAAEKIMRLVEGLKYYLHRCLGIIFKMTWPDSVGAPAKCPALCYLPVKKKSIACSRGCKKKGAYIRKAQNPK